MDEKYKALGVQHHEQNTEIKPLEHTSVRATVAVVLIFIACFIGSLVAVGVIRP